jgi:uridine phosphorylase
MLRENVHQNFGGQCQKGDVAPYVLITGSKDRVRSFAAQWDNSRQVADHYEYLVCSGTYAGFPISACSTGIGGMSVAIAIEELAKLGANTFFRVGVTSPLVDELEYGEIVIAKGAVRWDGTSHDYVRPEYPAQTHFEVVMAAISAAEHYHYPYKVGVIGDLASLGPEREDGFRGFLGRKTRQMHRELYEAGVIDGTGEAATMLVQSSIYGLRAGVANINSVDKVNHRWDPDADKKVIQLGLETMRILAAWDQAKAASGHPFMVPDILETGPEGIGGEEA